jgi:hypothetical protein
VSVRELTQEEARELSYARTIRCMKDKNDVPPLTPEEARYHAREFIAHNGENNLVALLAHAFIELQDAHA